MKFVLLQDIVIPAGTVLDGAPTNRGGDAAVEAVVAMGKDSTAYLHMSLGAIDDAPELVAPADLFPPLKLPKREEGVRLGDCAITFPGRRGSDPPTA